MKLVLGVLSCKIASRGVYTPNANALKASER